MLSITTSSTGRQLAGGALLPDRSGATQPPETLRRPAARPGPLRIVAVGADRIRGWARLDQVQDLEPVGVEQPDPLTVGQLEHHLVVGVDPVHPK